MVVLVMHESETLSSVCIYAAFGKQLIDERGSETCSDVEEGQMLEENTYSRLKALDVKYRGVGLYE